MPVMGNGVILDFEDFLAFRGRVYGRLRQGYPSVTKPGTSNACYLHQAVLGFPGKDIDHKNRNKLDCRKSNLRLTNKSENALNAGIRENNTTGYRGVSFYKRLGKFRAYHTFRQNVRHLGMFTTAKEAAICYNVTMLKTAGYGFFLNEVGNDYSHFTPLHSKYFKPSP